MSAGQPGLRRRELREALDDATRDARRRQRLAAGDDTDGLDELLGGRVLVAD